MSLKLIRKLIKMGTQAKSADDSGDYQKVQVTSLGQVPEIRAITPYGLYSSAPIGSEWVVMNLRANSDDKVGIGNDFVNRFKGVGGGGLKEGETALVNLLTGSYIYLQENGDIKVIGKNDLNVDIDGDVNINVVGKVNVTADSAEVNISKSCNLTCPNTTWTGNFTQIGNLTTSTGSSGTATPTSTITVSNGIVTNIN